MNTKRQHLFLVSVLLCCLASVCFGQAGTVQLTYAGTTQYATIAAAYAAIPSTITGPALIELLSGYNGTSETFPITLSPRTGVNGTNTITIRPAVTGIIISVASGGPQAFAITGSYIILDGRVNGSGSTKDMVIQTTITASSPVIQLNLEASNNVIKYCKLYSGNTSSTGGVIKFNSNGIATGIDNNTIDNCDIGPYLTNLPRTCFYSVGASATITNDNNVISNCNIFDWFSSGNDSYGISITNFNTTFTVTSCSFYQTATRNPGAGKSTSAIFINDVGTPVSAAVQFTNNYIGGSQAQCGGTPMTISSDGVLRCVRTSAVSNTVPTVISGNTIQNISFAEATTNTSNCAIQLGASTSQGLFTVTGNSISNISVTLADATAEFNVITSSTAAIATIYGNKIFGLSYATATSAGNSTLRGINLSAGNTSVCYNNMISLGSGSETGNWTIYGIEKGTTNSTSFYFNTIYLYGTASSSVNSAAFKRTGSGTDVVKDNIFYNTRTPGTGSQAAIIINNNTTFTSDYNDLYSTTSATVGSVGGATFTDFSTWKSGSGQDANSKSIAVNFSSTTDLHLTAGSIGDVNLTGTPVGSITTDYDAEVRSVSFPYMGADENLSSPLPVELASFTGSARGRNVELLWNTATESNNNGFEVQKNVNGSWTKIGFVDGAGTSNAPHSYNFVYVNSAASKYSYRLKQIDRNGKFTYSNSVEVATTLTAEDFTLSQNYPNPFNPSTKFSFAAKSAERTTLKIYNVVGQEVATLFNGVAQPDQIYTLSFNAKDLPSGMYFYVLHSASRNEVKKMMLLK